ncbi:hypothetical protein [Chitinimonas prasina]|nr:hypothetical protein [Chitinimonas prasina]
MSFSIKLTSEDGDRSVVVDDDGRVAYAYLLDANGKICGDVWLYNRCAAPVDPEWTSPGNAPFANPMSYVRDVDGFEFPESGREISAEWMCRSDKYVVKIFLHGKNIAMLEDGAKPGLAYLAKKDGPLAKVLERIC